MIRLVLHWFFIFFLAPCYAMLVGNPAAPGLQTKSILNTTTTWVSCRLSYLDDWVYLQRFHDEFHLEGTPYTQTFLKLSTYAGMFTINFKDRIDLYGLAGSSRIQIDKEIFTKRALAWGVGTTLIIFEEGDFFIGTDVKYFETNQIPKYFVVDGLPYNIVSNFRLHYHEFQAAVGMTYRISPFAPYIQATYLISKIEPVPLGVLVRLPDADEVADVTSKSIITKKRLGMALGLSLIDEAKATLAFEWRLFNQNGIDWNLDIRF